MTGLRREAIEAAARELWRTEYGAEATPETSPHEEEFNVYTLPASSRTLDAILDYLEANADEWQQQGDDEARYNSESARSRDLIAVLRDPVTVEPEET